VALASGNFVEKYIQAGDSLADIANWGFNAVYYVFSTACDRARGNQWQAIDVQDTIAQIEPDVDVRWQGKWCKPSVYTPVLPFALSFCSNIAVTWTEAQRRVASQTAFQGGPGFMEAPTTLFKIIKDKCLDLVIMDDSRQKTTRDTRVEGCVDGSSQILPNLPSE